ncbi:PstS family phosphate ABC transporter substrate-binding protein [cf. Phormidesmis sp. LEGE 11477]|uniref:PstS family phosphate ABC transporter substrate-binding protein n=1 Tax=cf. Phormidesmis sp. LEGE 11477 TaxID=1828680 RepID=UPI00187EB211|nr:PstS family phosphate ABC transporter substrate-binding protein [cf. Phormidesmis sp. LEGE 11477]MBE9062343.1 PstS family phosphate ABC transporter substrate-binding protein [cf. Phormidesmis sp. LEGE 11477]
MQTKFSTAAAIFGTIALTTACTAPTPTSDQGSILGDGEYSTRTINVTRFARGNFIKVDGSSTVFPISYEAAQRYQQSNSDAPAIAVTFSGTSSGFERFCTGETDINNASRPITTAEMAACKANGIEYLELPIALDAITVVVHPENDWAEDITLEELQTIWQPDAADTINNWNQVRSSWPDRPLNLFGPGEESGTFDYFTEVIVDESGASRTDYTQSEDDSALVEAIADDPDALGYFGLGYYAANWNRLKSLAIDNGQQSSQPTIEAVKDSTYQPLTRPLLLYVDAEALETKPELQSFVQFYLKSVQDWVPFVGYVPLEKETYKLVSERFEQQEIGTVYGGEVESELSIEERLQQESTY